MIDLVVLFLPYIYLVLLHTSYYYNSVNMGCVRSTVVFMGRMGITLGLESDNHHGQV